MKISHRLLIGVSVFSIAIVGTVSAFNNHKTKAESVALSLKNKDESDKARCRELTEKINGMRQEHLTLLARNRNDPSTPEVSEFLKKLRPLLKEYTELQLNHPEWEGKPQ